MKKAAVRSCSLMLLLLAKSLSNLQLRYFHSDDPSLTVLSVKSSALLIRGQISLPVCAFVATCAKHSNLLIAGRMCRVYDVKRSPVKDLKKIHSRRQAYTNAGTVELTSPRAAEAW